MVRRLSVLAMLTMTQQPLHLLLMKALHMFGGLTPVESLPVPPPGDRWEVRM